jgi:lysophospholipase L1-like esterase
MLAGGPSERHYHNAQWKACCDQHWIPLSDVCSYLRDEHSADELHPNETGARIIAAEVLTVLAAIHNGPQRGMKC